MPNFREGGGVHNIRDPDIMHTHTPKDIWNGGAKYPVTPDCPCTVVVGRSPTSTKNKKLGGRAPASTVDRQASGT